jgi:hypothetical protein
LWRRSQEAEALPDEAAWLLDLAALADNRLDDDDTARVAALIARDPDAAGDVDAARLLAGATILAAEAGIIARAEALVGDGSAEASLIAFPVRRSAPRRWYGAATWSGLAAAVVMAGWLGFDLGSGLFGAPPSGRSGDDVAAGELLDPAPLMLRDFTDNSQT